MNETIALQVTEHIGTRLDKYLAMVLGDYTRSFLQKQIECGNVTVNGKVQHAKYKVNEGEHILVEVPPAQAVDILAENI